VIDGGEAAVDVAGEDADRLLEGEHGAYVTARTRSAATADNVTVGTTTTPLRMG
jgi:hypothetical protein